MPVNKFLDPKNNYAFQRIFGTEKNKDILIQFLNDVLVCAHRSPVVDVTFLKTIQDPDIAAQKVSIVDILCKDQSGHSYVVEMQIAHDKGFEKRAQYYAAKAYTSQLLAGGKYHDLKEVVFLAIADFIMFPDKTAYKSDHLILDRLTHDHDLKDFSFTFLELPKFNKSFDELENSTDQWMYFFKHAPETHEDDLDRLTIYPAMERAYGELNRFSWSPQELRTYDQIEKYENVYNAALEYQFDKGVEKGMEKGMEKGREKGRQEGEQETLKKTALSMLAKGYTPSDIADITGLCEDMIADLGVKTKV